MRGTVPDGGARPLAVLDQYEPAKERARYLSEGPFAVGRPQVNSGSDGLFRAIVEVVFGNIIRAFREMNSSLFVVGMRSL